MIDPADVRALAKADCEAITNHLLGQSPNRALSRPRQGKLRYYPRGGFELCTATGKWRSYSDDAHGDMADLVIRQGEAGDQSAALKWLMRWLGIEGELGPADEAKRRQREGAAAQRMAEAKAQQRQKRRVALALWEAGKPLLGSPGEFYLRRRLGGLEVPHAVVRSAQLRFHPDAWTRFDIAPDKRPATIGALSIRMVEAASGDFVGVHRVFLDDRFDKVERKMLGGSGVCMVAHGRRSGPLGLAEGLEDAIALLAAGWPGSLWAALNAGNMGGFPVLAGEPELILFPDNDKVGGDGRQAGADAEAACRARWEAAGRRVTTWWPAEGVKDFDELLKEARRG